MLLINIFRTARFYFHFMLNAKIDDTTLPAVLPSTHFTREITHIESGTNYSDSAQLTFKSVFASLASFAE